MTALGIECVPSIATATRPARLVTKRPPRGPIGHMGGCETRRDLSRQIADVVSRLELLSVNGTDSLQERKEARQNLSQLRYLYWKHVNEHGCKDPTDRLRAIMPG